MYKYKQFIYFHSCICIIIHLNIKFEICIKLIKICSFTVPVTDDQKTKQHTT